MFAAIIHFLQMTFLYSLAAALIVSVIFLIVALECLKYKDEQQNQHNS